MTSFMMPHIHGRLMPENLNLVITNGFLKPKINQTLANYISIATKASEQYSEIWETMSKITHMYDVLGEKPTQKYEIQEIFNVFKLSPEITNQSILNDDIIKNVLEIIGLSKKGGNAITRTGSLFSQIAIDCMYILSLCFNEVYIYKPAASNAISPEKYVICKDFKLMSTDYLKPAFNHICSILQITNCNRLSLYTRRINSNYINTLIEANSVIGQQQLEAFNNTITLIEQGRKKERIDALKRQQSQKCSEWHKKFGVSYQQELTI